MCAALLRRKSESLLRSHVSVVGRVKTYGRLPSFCGDPWLCFDGAGDGGDAPWGPVAEVFRRRDDGRRDMDSALVGLTPASFR
jgi:hypothetical protein